MPYFFYRPTKEYSSLPTPARRARVVRSPRLAAIGVATLSGLMFTLRDNMTTQTMRDPETQRIINQFLCQSQSFVYNRWSCPNAFVCVQVCVSACTNCIVLMYRLVLVSIRCFSQKVTILHRHRYMDAFIPDMYVQRQMHTEINTCAHHTLLFIKLWTFKVYSTVLLFKHFKNELFAKFCMYWGCTQKPTSL